MESIQEWWKNISINTFLPAPQEPSCIGVGAGMYEVEYPSPDRRGSEANVKHCKN